jgi:peptidoglycan/LPS O-acetylase OafA/YrhL
MAVLFLLLFLVPVVALCWRVVVSRTHADWLRIGAAGAAMTTAVGAFVVFDDLSDFEFKDWRSDAALLAAASGSVYLLAWAMRPHGNHRHRTISIIAAIVGLVPVAGTLATTLIFGGQRG